MVHRSGPLVRVSVLLQCASVYGLSIDREILLRDFFQFRGLRLRVIPPLVPTARSIQCWCTPGFILPLFGRAGFFVGWFSPCAIAGLCSPLGAVLFSVLLFVFVSICAGCSVMGIGMAA